MLMTFKPKPEMVPVRAKSPLCPNVNPGTTRIIIIIVIQIRIWAFGSHPEPGMDQKKVLLPEGNSTHSITFI